MSDRDFTVDSNGYFNFSNDNDIGAKEEAKCGVSSCLVYDEDFDGNCGTFYSGDLTKCKRFTQEKEEEPSIEPKTFADIAEEKKSCGRKIYF